MCMIFCIVSIFGTIVFILIWSVSIDSGIIDRDNHNNAGYIVLTGYRYK